MSRTPYSLDNRLFSERASRCAQRTVYPQFFKKPASDIQYTAPTLTQDAKHGIDRILKVSVAGLQSPLSFYVQERFRRPSVALYNDITLSEWLGNSDRPAELYHIQAALFLYGRYDEERDTMVEALFFWVAPVLHGLASGSIPFSRRFNAKQGKYFIAIPIPAMRARNLIAWHRKERVNAVHVA